MKQQDYHPKCFVCGTELVFQDSEMCEVATRSEAYKDDDEAIMNYYLCPCCGRSYEVYDPSREEKEGDYKAYWDNNN